MNAAASWESIREFADVQLEEFRRRIAEGDTPMPHVVLWKADGGLEVYLLDNGPEWSAESDFRGKVGMREMVKAEARRGARAMLFIADTWHLELQPGERAPRDFSTDPRAKECISCSVYSPDRTEAVRQIYRREGGRILFEEPQEVRSIDSQWNPWQGVS